VDGQPIGPSRSVFGGAKAGRAKTGQAGLF